MGVMMYVCLDGTKAVYMLGSRIRPLGPYKYFVQAICNGGDPHQ